MDRNSVLTKKYSLDDENYPLKLDKNFSYNLYEYDCLLSEEENIYRKFELIDKAKFLEKADPNLAIYCYSSLLKNSYFENDYFPYRRLVMLYKKTKRYDKVLEIIKSFTKSGIYCSDYNIIWFKNNLIRLKEKGLISNNDIDEILANYNEYGAYNDYSLCFSIPVADRFTKKDSYFEIVPIEIYNTFQKKYMYNEIASEYKRNKQYEKAMEIYWSLINTEFYSYTNYNYLCNHYKKTGDVSKELKVIKLYYEDDLIFKSEYSEKLFKNKVLFFLKSNLQNIEINIFNKNYIRPDEYKKWFINEFINEIDLKEFLKKDELFLKPINKNLIEKYILKKFGSKSFIYKKWIINNCGKNSDEYGKWIIDKFGDDSKEYNNWINDVYGTYYGKNQEWVNDAYGEDSDENSEWIKTVYGENSENNPNLIVDMYGEDSEEYGEWIKDEVGEDSEEYEYWVVNNFGKDSNKYGELVMSIFGEDSDEYGDWVVDNYGEDSEEYGNMVMSIFGEDSNEYSSWIKKVFGKDSDEYRDLVVDNYGEDSEEYGEWILNNKGKESDEYANWIVDNYGEFSRKYKDWVMDIYGYESCEYGIWVLRAYGDTSKEYKHWAKDVNYAY